VVRRELLFDRARTEEEDIDESSCALRPARYALDPNAAEALGEKVRNWLENPFDEPNSTNGIFLTEL